MSQLSSLFVVVGATIDVAATAFGAGPICPPGAEVRMRAGEQPSPRAIAGSSAAYVGSAISEPITQFWLGRFLICELFRFRYIHPPTSPDHRAGGKTRPEADCIDVAGV